MQRNFIGRVFLVATSLLLVGCAGPGTLPEFLEAGKSSRYTSPAGQLPASVASGTPLLVKVTYPSEVTPEALSVAEASYSAVQLGFNAPYGEQRDPQALLSALTKSSYLAHEFHRVLARTLPPDNIVLSPAVVDLRDGLLVYREKAQSLPAAVTVDMMAFVAPKSFWGIPQSGTRGRVASLLFDVRTAAGVGGLARPLAISKPLTSTTTGQPSALLALLQSGTGTVGSGSRSDDIGQVFRSVVELPWLDSQMSDLGWAGHVSRTGSNRAVFGEVSMIPAAALLRAALLNDSWRSDYAAAEARWFNDFRKSVLASGGQVKSPSDETLLRELLNAEATYAVRVSRAASVGLFEGDWGKVLRTSFESEHKTIGEAARRVQSLAFGGGAGLAAMVTAIAATRDQTMQMQASHAAAFAPVLIQAESLRMNVGGRDRDVSVAGSEELRARLVEIYRELFP